MSRVGRHSIEYARQQLARGQLDGAIQTLVRLLGDDADDADPHALLAHALLGRKRVHAAAAEARIALELDPESLPAQLAAAGVAIAQRRFRDAQALLDTARTMYPDAPVVEDMLARLHLAWGRDAAAATHNGRALELDPDDADYLALAASLAWRRGDRVQAEAIAREALHADGDHIEAICVLGHVALARGDVDEAREHAAWALQIDAMNAQAIALLCAINARRSPLLGAWWRFQAFVSAGPAHRAITLLLGMYLAYRVASLWLTDHGQADAALILSGVWLGFCVYTWVAPSLFWKAVRRELAQVRLDPKF